MEDLASWEREGATLELTGRGDPLPASLAAIVPPHLAIAFDRLVQSTVEVGIVDMYGKGTEEPFRFLNEVVKVLEQSGVSLPDVDDLFNAEASDRKNERFGDTLSAADVERVWERYRKISSERA